MRTVIIVLLISILSTTTSFAETTCREKVSPGVAAAFNITAIENWGLLPATSGARWILNARGCKSLLLPLSGLKEGVVLHPDGTWVREYRFANGDSVQLASDGTWEPSFTVKQ